MTDREKMEIIIKAKGDCSHMSIENYFSCGSCPIEKECNNTSIPPCGRSLRLAKEWIIEDDKKEHGMKFKVGDLVKCTDKVVDEAKFRGTREITGFIFNVDYMVGEFAYREDWLELAEEAEWQPVKGKRYEVSNYSCFTDSEERIFWEENKEFKSPYSCVHCGFEEEYERGFRLLTMSYKYIREIQPKYKAYTEPKLEWIGKEVNRKDFADNKTYKDTIEGFTLNSHGIITVLFKGGFPRTLQECVEDITWIDGTPFGELINDK